MAQLCDCLMGGCCSKVSSHYYYYYYYFLVVSSESNNKERVSRGKQLVAKCQGGTWQ